MSLLAQLRRGLRATLLLWLLTVVVITLPMLGIARLVAPQSAEGSLLRRDGAVVGSRLLGQSFRSSRYLQGRPAGAVALPPADPALRARVAADLEFWRQSGIERPAADLLLVSGSGVDPHISLGAARQQLPRLARERRQPLARLERLLRRSVEGPAALRAIEPVVNVLRFNLALDQLAPQPQLSPQPQSERAGA